NPTVGEQYALMIGSSSASLFTVDTTGTTTVRGTASSTNAYVSNLGGANCDVKAGPGGYLYCGTDASGSSFAFPWTTGLSTFATTTASTTSSIWTQGVFFSSSTVAASQFPYASSTALSASGLSFFNGGFLATASSTIGGGTNGAGLTINGGATTTGLAYF